MINGILHYILSNNLMSIENGVPVVMSIFLTLGLITLLLIYIEEHVISDILEIASVITMYLTIIIPIIVAIALITISVNSTTENNYGDWKEIYTNELNADVKLKSKRGFLELTAGQPINTDPEKLNKNWYAKLTIQKDNVTVTRQVTLNKDSFITNGKISKNSKIVKVEYRTIEGYTKSAFGQTGDFIELKDTGEVRVTIEPSDDEKKLNELLQ